MRRRGNSNSPPPVPSSPLVPPDQTRNPRNSHESLSLRPNTRQTPNLARSIRPEMWSGKGGDLEDGTVGTPLYPGMTESPELRWSFIRKIYSILTVQLLLTIVVASVVVKVTPIAVFFTTTSAGFGLYIFLVILPLLLLCPLYSYRQSHPVNFILLGLYTVALSFTLGIACAFTSGVLVLEAAILTAVVFIGLTLYTFWAAKRGHDFSFLGPFLSCALLIVIVFGLIQIFFPLGRVGTTIYGAIGAIVISGFIIYDTDNVIKRYTYDEYVWASVALYIDILNLFLFLLDILRANN